MAKDEGRTRGERRIAKDPGEEQTRANVGIDEGVGAIQVARCKLRPWCLIICHQLEGLPPCASEKQGVYYHHSLSPPLFL